LHSYNHVDGGRPVVVYRRPHHGEEAAVTAVPLPGADHGQDSLLLVCDRCGDGFMVADGPGTWVLVWRIVSAHGWSGSPLTLGPHHCPACTMTSDIVNCQDPGTD